MGASWRHLCGAVACAASGQGRQLARQGDTQAADQWLLGVRAIKDTKAS